MGSSDIGHENMLFFRMIDVVFIDSIIQIWYDVFVYIKLDRMC